MNYGYIRYSDGRQERGSSVARQEDLIKLRCPDIATENIFIDRGVSSFRGANLEEGSQWCELLKVAKSGSTIYVEQIDRLTRAGIDKAQELFRNVRKAGINIVTTVDGHLFEGGKDTDAGDAIRIVFAADLGRAESASKSKRVAASYVTRNDQAAEGKKIKIPLASWLDYDNGKYKLNHRAEIVKLIFEMCISGTGAAAIAIELNKRGVKPFKFEKKEEKAKREGKKLEVEEGKEASPPPLWGAASVFVILRNKACYGTYIPSAWKIREAKRTGEVFENTTKEIADYFPAVITEHTYYAAQEALRIRRNTRATKQSREDAPFNLYQGVAQCACGSRLHVMAKGVAKQRYLVCAGMRENFSGFEVQP
ncbi:recombinase family protein [Undibacterium sp. Ji22W]|uniref:recombinase family protein n=1 Tax=Undibacterium sp. Ji22W TaxID=3413038 RepID=UPI003BF2E927